MKTHLLAFLFTASMAFTGSVRAQIYVTNVFPQEGINQYNLDGTPIGSGQLIASGLSSPDQIAVAGSSLFVANAGNGSIGEYTTSGGTVSNALISGLSGPDGVAVSVTDLFVANSGSNTIGEYTSQALPLTPR